MSRMTGPANSLCFSMKMTWYQPPQIPCVFSGKMRLANNVTVNSYDTRPTAPGFRIFFRLKRASRKPFQIPFVVSMKVCLAFKVLVNLYVMRSIALTFLVFFRRKCASQCSCRIPWVHFPCVFSGEMRLAFNVIVNSHDTRATAPGFRIFFQLKRASRKPFQIPRSSMKVRRAFEVIVNLHLMRLSLPHSLSFPKKMCLAGILPHSLGSLSSVFSGNPVLRSEVIVNLHVMPDAASCSLIPKIFPRKTRLAGGIPLSGHCHCKFSFVPKPGRSQILTKEHCTGDVGLFDSQFLPNRGSLL